ncbi:hypothetical protein M9H77_00739 [Catharanthus roseus]|uniref:Uncharacterized protein n=1 Tax=Catharanthus roseus TaxID=4058 RepID=A0ACC0C3U3_CATRO|nr:hypothetical protein M9H77_00739 [Catharanthus roseus]
MGNQTFAPKYNVVFFLLLFINSQIFSGFSCCEAAVYSNISCIGSERWALLNLKKCLIDKSNRLSSWIGENCCKWKGASCNMHTGRVIKLDLHNPDIFDSENLSLGGEISSSLLNLKYLQHLDLSRNNFSGIKIPTFFGSFKYMRYLNLSEAEFQGEIPSHLGNLSKLQYLDIGKNYHSKIKSFWWISRLSSLRSLDLSWVNLSSAHDWLQAISMLPSLQSINTLADIDLSSNLFQGNLPLCLQNLTSLTALRLSSNSFQGIIPFEIGHLKKLKELDLSLNKFGGTIPSSLWQLNELQSLLISHNSFVGDITEIHFARLTELKSLDISWTSLRMNVSSRWFPPFQLDEISLDSIQVGSQFPPWLEMQKRVMRLSMSNASISDAIPSWFEVVYSHIRFLDLSNNQISGKLPKILGSRVRPFTTDRITPPFVNLEHLNLHENNFIGKIPSDICKLSSLKILDLSSNNLSGEIPLSLGNLQNLVQLNLANNSLFGQIPSSLGGSLGLVVLLLNENNFHGHLPASMQNLSNLMILDIGDNQLSGTIPRWFSKAFPYLAWLRLQSNKFNGDIPVELCQLSFLQVLNLAQNNLTGIIPRCFGNFTAMASKSASSVKIFNFLRFFLPSMIKGRELMYPPSSLPIISISISDNKINGEIPKELMELVGLQSLNLSKNHLQGSIPKNIGNLKELESLDLSTNELSGFIPPSLATIDALGYLNLSFNKLSGQIPQGNHFQTFDDKSIYEGNRGLCSKPLQDCVNDKPSKEDGPQELHRGERESSCIPWFFAGFAPGFSVGLVGFFIVLRFKKSWRYAYFRFVENLCSNIWMQILVKFSLLWRKFKGVSP